MAWFRATRHFMLDVGPITKKTLLGGKKVTGGVGL